MRARERAPQTDGEHLFCERWLIHFDKDRAYTEAGYSRTSNGGTGAGAMLERFAAYLRPIREAKIKVMATRLAVDTEKIIAGMSQKVFFDPAAFYERASTPEVEWVSVPDCKLQVERVVTWDGKPVYAERLKPYSDLTADQQAVVQITNADGGRIKYRLPNIAEQHQYLTSLGRQLGMFAEKLIVERHNHKHTHAHLEFTGVPTQKLAALTRQMLPLVGLEFAKQLGYTAADIAAATAEDAVIAVVDNTPA